MFSTVNSVGFQHTMDEVKDEPESDTDSQQMILSSYHQLLDENDGRQIPFHVLQKGIEVSIYFHYFINFELLEECLLVVMKLGPSCPCTDQGTTCSSTA
jgi:hypothetical protein